MRFDLVEKYRIKHGELKTPKGTDFGFFFIPTPFHRKAPLKVICAPSDEAWQHVSVSLPDRCPTWDEMCLVKNLFWTEDDCVMQYHPSKVDYISNHKFCLHLWKLNDGREFPKPPLELIGAKSLGELPVKGL